MHGYFSPIDYATGEKKDTGLTNMIPQFQKDGNTLILDGGDTIQGSPFTMLMSRSGNAALAAELMNLAGYDFLCLGNHDFNYGYDYLASYLENLDGTCLCSAVRTMENGLKVGIIGMCTEFVTVWTAKEHLEKLNIEEVRKALEPVYEEIRPQVDVLIGLYHGGFERDIENGRLLSDTRENIGYEICCDFDFDLLLTGHQHIAIPSGKINGTYIAQTPFNASAYIEAELVFQDGHMESCTTELKNAGGTSSPEALELLKEREEETASWLDTPKGHFAKPLLPESHIQMALHGTPIADFFNEVQLWASGAELSCTSLGNEVKGFGTDVTVRDIVSTYIYPNTLKVLEVTGEVLRQGLERSAEYFAVAQDGSPQISAKFLQPKVAHYNFDYYAGIEYGFDYRRPEGERLTHLLYHGKPVEPEQKFTLVMNDYRASGTGGYEFFTKCPVVKEIQTDMVELIILYFESNK
jgi:2',3'-cyclic-nucleotide 2'-phosphodiesterase/3'-nucleotidase